jgi:serine/threonine protein kinase
MSAPGAAPELTVLGEIAKGGMGSVELARMVDAAGESLVAVKRMHPEHSRDLDFVRMFRDEIWLMGALRHPNIVSLVGWGEDEGGPYLVMEYVDGVALGRIAGVGRRARQPMPERLVAYAAARAADGLAAAHELADADGKPLEIVHRDVTPSNILVSFDGGVLVTDFGIAKAVGKSSHTRTGVIKGKIAYMSPEYAVRRPVDGRSDLYSLGVVMYEILTGELPFEASTDFELLKKVAYSPAPSISKLAPDLDSGLAAIIDRLLAKEPAERPADGTELAGLLDGWLKEKGFAPDVLRLELASYATQHAGKKHEKLMKLLDPDADTVPDDGSGPKRPKFITLGTRTFTLFDPNPPTETHPVVRPATKREEERPATRKVAVSDFPPPSAPVAVPVSVPSSPARTSAPSIPDGDRVSQPTPSRVSQPLIVTSRDDTLRTRARASVPPGAGLTPVVATRAIRAHSSAVLGGVVAGSAVALLLIVGTVVTTLRQRDDTTAPGVPAETGAAVPEVQPAGSTPAMVEPVPEPAEPAPSAAPEPPPASSASAKKPRTGKPPRQTVKVSKPPSSKGKQPCTPTSFDYPACLSH